MNTYDNKKKIVVNRWHYSDCNFEETFKNVCLKEGFDIHKPVYVCWCVMLKGNEYRSSKTQDYLFIQ